MSRSFTIHGQLELYAAGVLTTAETIAFDDHLQRCRDCQRRAPALLEAAVELVPDSPAPEKTWSRIVAAIERR